MSKLPEIPFLEDEDTFDGMEEIEEEGTEKIDDEEEEDEESFPGEEEGE
jgi:hypothetical protein